MRIASLFPLNAVNSIYRSLIPMQALAQRGHTVHLEERNDIRDPDALFSYDLVHFLRFYHGEMVLMARRLQEAGVAVVWDNDDDLTAIPKGNPGHRWFGGLRGQRAWAGMTAMMRHADLVTTPSAVLAEKYESAGGTEARVLENYLPEGFVKPRVVPHSNVRIGWLAALEHHLDFEALRLGEVFERLLRRHSHLEILSIGLGLGIRNRRYHAYPITPYGELPALLGHIDIGIAPLVDIAFNRARSNIKAKEYAAMGATWLASPVGGYVGLGEQEGGRLVADDDWYAALDGLIVDADARRRLAVRARRWAQDQMIDNHVDGWETAFAHAVEHARATRAARV